MRVEIQQDSPSNNSQRSASLRLIKLTCSYRLPSSVVGLFLEPELANFEGRLGSWKRQKMTNVSTNLGQWNEFPKGSPLSSMQPWSPTTKGLHRWLEICYGYDDCRTSSCLDLQRQRDVISIVMIKRERMQSHSKSRTRCPTFWVNWSSSLTQALVHHFRRLQVRLPKISDSSHRQPLLRFSKFHRSDVVLCTLSGLFSH